MAVPLTADRNIGYLRAADTYIVYTTYTDDTNITGVQTILDKSSGKPIQGWGKSGNDLVAMGAQIDPNTRNTIEQDAMVRVPKAVITAASNKLNTVMDTATGKFRSMADSATRQGEINEWTYNNKMETVFVLQVLFIGLVMISVVFYFNTMGMLTTGFAWYAAVLTTLIVLTIIGTRLYYTTARRDARFWNRRHFEEDRTMLSTYRMDDPGWRGYMSLALRNFEKNDCTNCSPAPA